MKRKNFLWLGLMVMLVLIPGTGRTEGVVIADVTSWSHPTKKILAQNQVSLECVELEKDRTYPVYQIKLPINHKLEDQYYFDQMLDRLATENGFWDFKLVDQEKMINVEVFCDRKLKRIRQVDYSSETNYFKQTVKVHLWEISDYVQAYFGILPKNYRVIFKELKTLKGKRYYCLEGQRVVESSKPAAIWGWYLIDVLDEGFFEWDPKIGAQQAFPTKRFPFTLRYPGEAGLRLLTRQEAGLSSIPNLDFKRFALNPRISRLLFQNAVYTPQDYQQGIVGGECLIINEHFTPAIIDQIKIGTSFATIKLHE